MTSYQDIEISTPAEYVLQITVNRPDVKNALRTELLGEIADVLDNAAKNDAVRAVVLTGGPDVFAAGADIKQLDAMGPADALHDDRIRHWERVRAFPKPVVAAVNGYALGGGCELAMSADILIAGDTAKFGQLEVNLGIVPGSGGTQLLTRIVGKSMAMKMVLSGEMIDAETALAFGLAAEMVPAADTIDRAISLAGKIATKAPLAVQLAKEAVIKSFDLPLEDGIAVERKMLALLCATEDKKEGIAAFFEKRKAVFTGR